MCEFFSCNSDGKGNLSYCDSLLRQALRDDGGIKLPSYYPGASPDSHSFIASTISEEASAEDKMNKYEFNPITKRLVLDQINVDNDSDIVEEKLHKLDWETIVPELEIKPPIERWLGRNNGEPTKKHIDLLREWAQVVARSPVNIEELVRTVVSQHTGKRVYDCIASAAYLTTNGHVATNDFLRRSGVLGISARPFGAGECNGVAEYIDSYKRDVEMATSASDVEAAYIASFFKLPDAKWYGGGDDTPFRAGVALVEDGFLPVFMGGWRLVGRRHAFNISGIELDAHPYFQRGFFKDVERNLRERVTNPFASADPFHAGRSGFTPTNTQRNNNVVTW